MYYDTIEEAIEANPHYTHVLTTGPSWSPHFRQTLTGKFRVSNVTKNRHYCIRDESLSEIQIGSTAWVVVFDNTVGARVPTTDQLVTAARFDTASGRIQAHEFLEKGVGHMKDRASQRDSEDGERSMKRCVEAFNALEGTNLTETQGWKFMVMLKMARSVSGDFTADDYEDMAAYAGLAGESASMENTK